MTADTLTAIATSDIAALAPTFRVFVSVTERFTLSATASDKTGRESVLSVSEPIPTDIVLRGTGRLLARLACCVNDARHTGLLVA